jgi:hypothetical protein
MRIDVDEMESGTDPFDAAFVPAPHGRGIIRAVQTGEPVMTDPFANTQPSLSSPASAGGAVTPSDTATFSVPSRALYVGNGGDLAVRMLSGDDLSFTGVSSGSFLPIRVTQVLSTGTTAGAIVALF